jgi:rod shape-determining protein MreC
MGVICSDGLVGIVKAVNRHYSSVIPILNRELFPNARIRGSNFYGYIEWEGKNYRNVILKDIPLHANLHVGDTIETSGETENFPEGILIGTIVEYEIEKGVNYNILVELSTDFKRLTNVWVIDNIFKEEQVALEDSVAND